MTSPSVTKSPCVKEDIYDIPRPFIFGHRGSLFTAPENTKLSFEESNKADGYETDVAISWDGVPFLVHDYSLKRTTDIDEVS